MDAFFFFCTSDNTAKIQSVSKNYFFFEITFEGDGWRFCRSPRTPTHILSLLLETARDGFKEK